MTNTSSATAFDACPHCGLIHTSKCGRIKAEEFYPNGQLKRVEYHEPRLIDPLPVPALPYAPWWVNPPWTCGGATSPLEIESSNKFYVSSDELQRMSDCTCN